MLLVKRSITLSRELTFSVDDFIYVVDNDHGYFVWIVVHNVDSIMLVDWQVTSSAAA